MSLIENLRGYDVNIEEALERFMGNEALYIQMLHKFPGSVQKNEVISFIDKGDLETAASNAHSLKGISGNLSITKLFSAYTEIVQDLRAGKGDEAKTKLEAILPLQNEIVSCIESDK